MLVLLCKFNFCTPSQKINCMLWIVCSQFLVAKLESCTTGEKNRKRGKRIRKRNQARKIEEGFQQLLFSTSLVLCCWCPVATFVSRLASLERFDLGPAQYHRWTIIQFVLANVVPAVPWIGFQPPIAPQIYLQHHRFTFAATIVVVLAGWQQLLQVW